MADELMNIAGGDIALAAEHKINRLLEPLNKEILLFDTYLSGFNRVDDQTSLDKLNAGDALILVREDDFLDDYAILVMDKSHRKIGYIAEKDNIIFARLMDAGKRLCAKVRSNDPGEHFRKIRISIFLVDF